MIRFGIIGTNKITENFLKGALLVDDFKLTAIYSRNEVTAKDFANKYNAENIFTNIEEMAKSNVIDAVYIASPNALHASQSILFLKNKKHVLCEKAFASNSKEVIEMIETASENNVLLMEAMKTTVLPNFKVVKDNLHKLGKIRRYFASYCQYSSRYDKYKQGEVLNAFKPELSNGALVDIGVYCIAPMVNLFGKPCELQSNALMLESGVDGQGSILFKYADMDGVVMYSKIANSYIPSEIQGENGSMIVERISTFENVKIIYRDGTVEDLSQKHIEEDMYYETKEFIELIKASKIESTVNTLENSKVVVELMEEARKQVGVVYPSDTN